LCFLGNQTLRDFVFNEIPSGSFIDTIHESCLAQIDESINKSYVNNDDIDNDDGYNHEELIHAAIEDLNDDSSHANEIFKNALNELSNQDPSSIHSNLGFQSQQSTNVRNDHIHYCITLIFLDKSSINSGSVIFFIYEYNILR
jgi:hypothetical protein